MKNLQQVLASDDALLDRSTELAVKGGNNGGNDQSDPPDPPMWPIDWSD